MLVVGHMRDHSRELLECGGVKLDDPTLGRLGDQAGLGRTCLPAILDRWTRDGDDGRALLKPCGGKSRYTLGDAYFAQRRFLEEGARREIAGEIAGKRGAVARCARLHRKGAHR